MHVKCCTSGLVLFGRLAPAEGLVEMVTDDAQKKLKKKLRKKSTDCPPSNILVKPPHAR
jgi:hypothetical protein